MQPLAGVRVLAVEHFLAGPFGSMMLADAGAEVIKIERVGTGDAWRQHGKVERDGKSIPHNFLRVNRNKKSVTLNLKSEKGRDLFRKLVTEADVVWENLSAGEMDRLGVGFDALQAVNPAIIYASVSGFGHTGPYAQHSAFDYITQAMGGLMWMPSQGEQPMWLGFPLTDMFPGVLAVLGVLTALRSRDKTGRGQRIDVAMYDSAVALNERAVAIAGITGQDPVTSGAVQATNQLGTVPTADGYVAIGIVENPVWAELCRLIGRMDLLTDPNLSTVNQRAKRLQEVVIPAVAAWTSSRPRQEVARLLRDRGVPLGEVQELKEIATCPHLKARHMLIQYEDPLLGPITTVGSPIKTSLNAEPPTTAPPPTLGQHNEEILGGLLGLDRAELDRLLAEKIV